MPAVTFATRANIPAKIAGNTIEVRSLRLLSCQGGNRTANALFVRKRTGKG